MDYRNHQPETGCTDNMGVLPCCAPLANPYVPFQQENAATYQAPMGLVRGTLYPGLDLPFMGMVNQNEQSHTPMHQLQALNFAISELGLYLDTHPTDQEAIDLFNQYVEQYSHAMQQYEQNYGPLNQMSSALSGTYEWTKGPWPWDYDANKEG